MKRRVVLVTCLLGLIGGSAGAALAAPKVPVELHGHNVCIVTAQNEDYKNTQYYCITTP